MNIFKFELKRNFKQLMVWSVILAAFIFLAMTKLSGLVTESFDINEILNKFPKIILAMMGMANANLTSTMGIFALLSSYLLIFMGILALQKGNKIITREGRDKTASFLFAKPLNRKQIFFSKLLAEICTLAFLSLLIFALFHLSAMFFAMEGSLSGVIFRSTLNIFLTSLFFLSVGICLGSFFSKDNLSSKLATMIFFICYILSVVADVSENSAVFSFLTPFKGQTGEEVSKGPLNYVTMGYYLVLTVTMVILACWKFDKIDLQDS